MIVLEGPDGGGKTTLMNHLQDVFGLHVAARFASSDEGPKDNLDQLVIKDMVNYWDGSEVRLYDRHPFISEFIYGPIIRGKVKDGLDRRNMLGYRAMFDMKALVILCVPPFEVAYRNVTQEKDFPQMPGVEREFDRIYTGYHRELRSAAYEPIWYDYTMHTPAYVEKMVAEHIHNWKAKAA